MRTSTRRWASCLGWIEALVAASGLLGIAAGLVLIASDEADDGEMFDGLGTFLGLLVGGAGLVAVVLGGGLCLLTRSALKRDDVGRLRLAGLLAAAVGATWCLVCLVALAQSARPVDALTAALPGLVVLVPALGTVLTGHPTD